MALELTEQNIRELPPAFPGKCYVVADTLMPGLGVRVNEYGHKTFVVIFRYSRSTRVLGKLGRITLAEARTKAHLRLNVPDRVARKVAPALAQARLQALAKRILAFKQRGISAQCYLYRHYDHDGDLLYVGISAEQFRRQHHHIENAKWANAIFQIMLEPFATRKEALAAEALAIRTEFPRYNTVHNSYCSLLPKIARAISTEVITETITETEVTDTAMGI